jgi:hypothetical protein
MMRILIYSLLLCIIGGCAKQGTTTSDSMAKYYEELAYETLNVQPVQFFENSQKDYVLATYFKNEKDVIDNGILKYVIINIGEEKVEKEGVLPQGSIKWISDYEIEIYSPPGISKNQTETADDYKFIYNVKTGKTTNKKGASY